MESLVTTPDAEQPSVEERRALIERVAACEQISRSARLRDFLLYVGVHSLKDEGAEIHEQEIGARVFGRPASYDRSQDNIVRVNATELRKRIEAYFASTGADEKLIFEIPRGGYKPVFRYRLPRPAEQSAQSPSASTVETFASPDATLRHPRSSPRFGGVLWPAVSLVLAVVSIMLYIETSTMQTELTPWKSQPAVAAFWTGFLDPHRQTDLVLSDDSASVMEDITGTPLTLDDYLNRRYVEHIQSSGMSADRKEDVSQVLNHNLVTFGAVRAAQVLLGAIPPRYPKYLTLARYFTADEVNRDNVVLIGGRKSMPWDYLFDEQLNFVTDFDYAAGSAVVRNRNPKPGEQSIYTVPTTANSLIGYAVIAYLPNPNRSGKTIILAGVDSDATGAASAFLTSEDRMQKLRATLHSDRFPYFEVLLKTSRLSGTFFDAEVIAYRTYPNPH
jgi:hypothetical protein